MDGSADLALRDRHLDRLAAWVAEHGVAALTLETAANAAGISSAEIHDFFETKDEIVLALIARSRLRYRKFFVDLLADRSHTPTERRRAMWKHFVDSEPDFRIFFEAYGLALHNEEYREFIHGIDDWLELIKDTTEVQSDRVSDAAAYITLLLAVYRGAMMDLCATGARARVNAGMELFFKAAAWLHCEDDQPQR